MSKRTGGFSLLEVIVAVAITLTIMLAMFSGLNQVQRRYRGEQLMTEISDGLRGISELVSQEIALAGHHGFETRRLTAGVVGSLTAQTVTLDDATDVYVGQRLLVDVGVSQEVVDVTAVSGSDVTGIFRRNHLAGAALNPVGPFPSGVLPGSSATVLQIYGDLYDDGSLIYVEYRVTGDTVTRSETPVGNSTQNDAEVILDNVVANPGSVPVFQYRTEVYLGTTYVSEVTVTLTAETSTPDPEMGELRTQTVSFSVVPRNVTAAYKLDSLITGNDFLQTEPAGLPIPVS